MTNVGRATWNPARGSKNQGGINYVPSKQVSAQDVVVQPKLKTREAAQTVTRDMLEASDTKKATEVLVKEEQVVKEECEDGTNEEIKPEDDSEEALRRELEECEDEEDDSEEEDDDDDGLIKRKWYDDVVFKKQAVEPPKKKQFINDTTRNDYHQRFLDRFIK